MRRFDSEAHRLRLEGADLTGCTIKITYRQDNYKFVISNPPNVIVDEDGTTIIVTMSQLETSKFSQGSAKVQVSWINASGWRQSTDIGRIRIKPTLLEEVMEYGA